MLNNDSILNNDEISNIFNKTNLSPEMISSVKDFYKELDKSRSEMIEVYKKANDDKARRYDKHIEYVNNFYNKEIDYLISMSEKRDLTPEQEEEFSKKIAETITEARRELDEIIVKANEESEKETTKISEETVRSDKQKNESFNLAVTSIASAGLIISGTTVVIKSPKRIKEGLGLIGMGLLGLGVPGAIKLLPLLQSKNNDIANDVIDASIKEQICENEQKS